MIEHGALEALHRAQAKKDPKAIARAEALVSIVRSIKLDGFEDVPFPKSETPAEVKRFDPESRKALTKEGHTIYQIGGQSIAILRDAGRPFWSTWHKDYPDFEALTSRYSEVAINPNPDKFFLPKSNNVTTDEQLEMIAEYSRKLQRRLKDQTFEAIMGQAPDYVELAFSHLDATGDRLFGEKYDYNYARTQTPTVGTNVAYVGYFHADGGLDVRHWRRDRRDSGVFASPLVVPK